MSSKEQNIPDDQVQGDMEDTLEQQVVEKPETPDVVNPLAEELEKLKKQLTEARQREHEVMLRAKAEVENMRRRNEQDIEKAHKFALEKFSFELLPVIDSLERALELADKSNDKLIPMIEGIELTLKSLLDVVRKFGIEVVADAGGPFDPEIHQAMTMLESTEHKPNHVIMVMQKGYTLNGRLLRPAMVTVSKEKE